MTFRSSSDPAWEEDRIVHGYTLPRPARWPFRLPVIRHVRAIYLCWQVERQATMFGSLGIGLGYPNPYDHWVIFAIARGDC